jgi:hypothetical protein
MSDYRVIADVDETLRKLLWSHMEPDAEIKGILNDEQHITLEPPFKVVTDTDPAEDSLSLYLYRVSENADMKNRPLLRASDSTLRFPPLSLNFFYLVTPITSLAANDHKLLSKTMQVFYDNAILKGSQLEGALRTNAEELRVILNPMTLEDLNRLWSAFMRPLRLSVCYEVKVVFIDSEREVGSADVLRKKLDFTQFEGV